MIRLISIPADERIGPHDDVLNTSASLSTKAGIKIFYKPEEPDFFEGFFLA